ncbi:MAG: long-chain fatty acid--CoA ligase [Chthoniobacterales bacterium]|nr:long-chain fatty acid--CoA ligase [Chthoniobacterales bacterium]
MDPLVSQSPPPGNRIIPSNIADLYLQAASRYGDAPAFLRRSIGSTWEACSFSQLAENGKALATALISLGAAPRSHIAILSDNRLEWILTDCAVQFCGAANVPRGADITPQEIAYILSHADVEIAFVENPQILERLDSVRRQIRKLREVILIEPRNIPPSRHLHHFQDLLDRGRHLRNSGDRSIEDRISNIHPHDLFTLIYTSGTTGKPKGVMLTHANMVSQIRNLPFPLSRNDRALSILPVWHSYERVFEMVAISWGVATYYTSIRTIAEDLKSVRPTIMASAPRLWENLYQKILANVRNSSPLRQALFHLAYQTALRILRARAFLRGQLLDTQGRSLFQKLHLTLLSILTLSLLTLPHKFFDAIVLKKLRKLLGGNFRGTISGGGALQPHVDEFFNAIGIPVLEGYGMTETSPVLAVRTWENLVIGTVGPFYPETEIRIVDINSGEILYPNPRLPHRGLGKRGIIHARGPQVMQGYYKNPNATAEVLKDGWMNTGDIGMVTFNGCLKILGRCKDTIVLLSGENVEPVPIESRLVESPFIENCIVVGQDQKFLSALIVPSLDAFRNAGIEANSHSEIASLSKARDIINAEIRRLISPQAGFKPHERISDWRILPKPFEVGDELTPTFKLRRHIITERYANLINDIYRNTEI